MTAKSNMHVNSEQYKLQFEEKRSLNGSSRMVPDVLKDCYLLEKPILEKQDP